MKKFFEVTAISREPGPLGYSDVKYKRLIDLNAISYIYSDGKCVIRFEGERYIYVTSESYEAVRKELLTTSGGATEESQSDANYLDGRREDRGIEGIVEKLCELQNDHTWICQAVSNLITMMTKTDFKPAILESCYDKQLEILFSAAHKQIRDTQKRIGELEEENKKLQGE